MGLPILKTHLKDLPLSAEWKKDFMLYVIKHKIRHPKELDLGLIVDKVCPGQTSQSVSNYATCAVSDNKKKRNTAENHKDLQLFEILKIKMNNEYPNSPLFNEKLMEKDLQSKNDIVDLYKS